MDASQMTVNAYDFPHLVSLALVVALSTLIAGLWAEKRRGRDWLRGEGNFFAGFALAIVFMLFYSFVAFLLPAIVLTSIVHEVFKVPDTMPDVAVGETVVQLATLFSVGANFADVASTYGRANFWKHLREYLVMVVPAYYATMGIAFLGARALAHSIQHPPSHVARTWQLFALPTLAPLPRVNVMLLVVLVLATGAVSYFLRRRGEER